MSGLTDGATARFFAEEGSGPRQVQASRLSGHAGGFAIDLREDGALALLDIRLGPRGLVARDHRLEVGAGKAAALFAQAIALDLLGLPVDPTARPPRPDEPIASVTLWGPAGRARRVERPEGLVPAPLAAFLAKAAELAKRARREAPTHEGAPPLLWRPHGR